jgi:hypothetical protein
LLLLLRGDPVLQGRLLLQGLPLRLLLWLLLWVLLLLLLLLVLILLRPVLESAPQLV